MFCRIFGRTGLSVADAAPCEYFNREREAIRADEPRYGTVHSEEGLMANLAANCIPACVFDMDASGYEEFLAQRRTLMAAKIRDYFKGL